MEMSLATAAASPPQRLLICWNKCLFRRTLPKGPACWGGCTWLLQSGTLLIKQSSHGSEPWNSGPLFCDTVSLQVGTCPKMSPEMGMREKMPRAHLSCRDQQRDKPSDSKATTGEHSDGIGQHELAQDTGEVEAQRGKSGIQSTVHRCPKSKDRIHRVPTMLLAPADE